ncbi:4896_t:CDS:2, partial [Scutellospora calospora]
YLLNETGFIGSSSIERTLQEASDLLYANMNDNISLLQTDFDKYQDLFSSEYQGSLYANTNNSILLLQYQRIDLVYLGVLKKDRDDFNDQHVFNDVESDTDSEQIEDPTNALELEIGLSF